MLLNLEKGFFATRDDLTYDSPLLSGLTKAIEDSAIRKDFNLAFAAAIMTLNLFATREVITPTSSSMIMYLIIVADTGYAKDSFLNAPAEILKAFGQNGINVRTSISSARDFEDAWRVSPVVYNQINDIHNLFYRFAKVRNASVDRELDSRLNTNWSMRYNRVTVTTETLRRDAETINYPILNIFGESTTALLNSYSQERGPGDHFYNRFLIVEATGAEINEDVVSLDIAKSSIEGLLKFNSLSAASGDKFERVIPQFKVPWDTPEVENRFYDFADEIEAINKEHVGLYELFVRLAEMALRMATLIAVSRDFSRARITMRDLEFAINFVKKSGNTSARIIPTLLWGSWDRYLSWAAGQPDNKRQSSK